MYKNLTVLGPQRPDTNLPGVLEALGVRGPVAMITAGWRHDEGETQALERDLARPSQHLPLYQWFDRVMASDADLARAYSERSERMRAYKDLYRNQQDRRLSDGLQFEFDTQYPMSGAAERLGGFGAR